ncbi:transporter substrate-binding domain-containing protein [Streptomyces sp. NPDC058579]|uniref:transporter substrate-binding domain-containing protein n=1 Tax=Streptomyces sp. NPDC058579 TaxID=3346548 RepID=UPI00364BEA9E
MAALLTGCLAAPQPDDPSFAPGAPLFEMLPEKYRLGGLVRVGINSMPPLVYPQGGRMIGVEPDLAAVLGERLGVSFQFEHAEFADLLPGLEANRFDAVMSGIHDTRSRREGTDNDGTRTGAGVDFVRYFKAGTSILIRKGRSGQIAGLSDLCGRKVVVQKDTTVEETARQQARACEESDQRAPTVDPKGSHKDVLDTLAAGGVDAALMDYPSATHSARLTDSGRTFEVAGPQARPAPYGIAFAKDADKLRDAVEAALKSVIDSGEYAKILKKWDVAEGALTSGDL